MTRVSGLHLTGLAPAGTCRSGKQTFRTAKAAIRAKDQIKQVQLRLGAHKTVDHHYRCPTCGLWHLTSQTKEKTAA